MVLIVKKGRFIDVKSKRDEKGKPLKTKLIFTFKYNTDGSIKRYMARLVMLVLLELAGEIGINESDGNSRKKIAKACYGLKQAPRQFYRDFQDSEAIL
jgi:hypothetical protein